MLRLIAAGTAGILANRIGAAPNRIAWPRGAIIRTLLADLVPDALSGGATLFHEHLSTGFDFMPKVMAEFRNLLGPDAVLPALPPAKQRHAMDDLGIMAGEMRFAAANGVACIVDAGHPDMGRNIAFLRRLSRRSGMPIVAGTGYYAQPFYPPQIARWGEEEIAQDLIRQIKADDIGALGEIGTWDDMTPDERKVFRAVARAQVATDLPIFTHTNMGKGALQQLDVLESAGVRPDRVAIGHLGGLTDPKASVQKAICRRGAFVGFDRQGGADDSNQIPPIMALVDAGYADKLLLSSDFSFASDLHRSGGGGYSKTLTIFAPKLLGAGISHETLHGILTDNPRRLLAFIPRMPRGN